MNTRSKKLGYIAFDQYGNHYKIKKHPRKELINDHYLRGRVRKMYVDTHNRQIKHVGYVIGKLWVNVYQIYEMN